MNKTLSEEIQRQIEVDIPRTFPSQLSVEQKKSLENILRITALNHPIVIYFILIKIIDWLCSRNELFSRFFITFVK